MIDYKKKKLLKDAEELGCLTPFMSDLLTGRKTDLDAKSVEHTLKEFGKSVKRLKNEKSGRAEYRYKNGHDYKTPHGVIIGHETGLRGYWTGIKESKRGRIVGFSRASQRKFKKAVDCLDLPRGSIKYHVTLTVHHWGEENWKGKEWRQEAILDDFEKAQKTFSTSFARCFKRCAIIYRREMTEDGGPHIHAIVYTPLDYDWATDAYTWVAKMRKAKRQAIIDAGGIMPSMSDEVTDFVHNTFRVLWFNAIRCRPIPQCKMRFFWQYGVCTRMIDEEADPDYMPKLINYLAKTTQCYPRGKPWGKVQKKNLEELKPEAILIPPEIRDGVLRGIWRKVHKDKPFPEKFTIAGLFVGVTSQIVETIVQQVKKTLNKRKRSKPPKLRNSTMRMTKALKNYLA
ncbi:MAG: hypothetical protein IJG18_07955 [Kiritimatiellae bacterium]|nr:hypothetical protein [Kiritimatiellia bacterium]